MSPLPSDPIARHRLREAQREEADALKAVELAARSRDRVQRKLDSLNAELVSATQSSAAHAWGNLTTLTRPDHEFVTASHELHATLKSLQGQIAERSPSVNRATAVDHLDRGIEAVDGFMSLTRSHPNRLLAAGILRGPARGLNPTAERLRDRAQGTYIPATLADVPELQAKWRAAGESLSQVRSLKVSSAPAMQL